MDARLARWRDVLTNQRGASMPAALGARIPPEDADAPIWHLGGDAAREETDERVGLGGFFYGIWWWVPDRMARCNVRLLRTLRIRTLGW